MVLHRLTAVSLVLVLFCLPDIARAATAEESGFLSLYFSEDELEVFSATRSLKSVASIAENVTVVTASDIELMNAHTVAEALYNVTGVELADFKGPGAGGAPSIQGSGSSRVRVMLDGVPLDTVNSSLPLSRLPVQMIKKIEIVKGPASSAWGSSFGGVINIITKSAEPGHGFRGTAYASYGEATTSDMRGELSGGSGRVGLYLFGGALSSEGVVDGGEFRHGDLFAKASTDAIGGALLDLSLYYHDSDSVNARIPFGPPVYDGFDLRTVHGKAALRTSFAGGPELSLSAWALRQDDNFYLKSRIDDALLRAGPTLDERYGLDGSLSWRAGSHAFVVGADGVRRDFEQDLGEALEIDIREYGLYGNDAIAAGRLTVTPGLRYDHSNFAGGFASPSLGAAYLASKDLLLRAIVSRGFHDPAVVRYFGAPALHYVGNPGLAREEIWSYEAGLEANVAGRMRTKLTIFYHDVDAILIERLVSATPVEGPIFTSENGGRANTLGGELELLSNRFAGVVLQGGFHVQHTKLHDIVDIRVAPVSTVWGVNASLDYDAGRGFRAIAKAHYQRWDMTDVWMSDDDGLVVDANLIQRVLSRGGLTLEAFFTAHNILDAASYPDIVHPNPGRWLEGGLRCSF